MLKNRLRFWLLAGLSGLFLALLPRAASAEVMLKMMIVNPSETEVKEYDIRSPLPPEVKPEHVLDSDGLKVDYDSQEGTFILVGHLTLKPKESVTKKIVLQDVWIVPADRFSSLRREVDEIMRKIQGTAYFERGDMLARAIERRLADAQERQDQASTAPPMQHITEYRDNLKTLDAIETDMVSLRQLMVMAALNTQKDETRTVPVVAEAGTSEGGHETGGLSILATWKLIFVILGLLGFVSLSFFMIWQRQLKIQLAKQAKEEELVKLSSNPEDLLQLPPTTDSNRTDKF